jgi:hypothetical protein
MPSWKKVAVSGSAASFSSLYVDSSVTASIFSGSQFIGNLSGTASYALTASYVLNGSSGSSGDSPLYILDKGVLQGTASYLDFTGAGVSATVALGTASINIPGGAGGDSSILNQTIAATTWSFTHNLGTLYPVFTIYDSNDNVIVPQQIHAQTTSSALIYFSSPRTGTAVASKGGNISTGSNALFIQPTPATTWVFNHNLNDQFPVFQVFNASNEVIIPTSITADSTITATITFNVPTAGTAVASIGGYTGSNLIASSSFASTASFAFTASYALNVPETASFAVSASHANAADTAISSSYSLTASYALNVPLTASNADTASFAISSSLAETASFVTTAQTASYVLNAVSSSFSISSSFATTSSFAVTALNALLLDGTSSLTFATTGSNTFIGKETISGSIKFAVTADPDLAGVENTTYLFASSSNTALGQDLYFRQNGNLTKWKWIEGQLATGLLYGGIVTWSGSVVYVSSGSGIIVNYNASTGSEISPVIDYVTWGPITASVTNITSSQVTYLYIDNNGTLQQQPQLFTSEQFQQYIPLGAVGHFDYTNVQAFGGDVNTAYGQQTQTNTFIDAFGPLKLNGYILTPQTNTLQLNVGSGTSFIHGGFYTQNQNDPSTLTSNSAITASIVRCYTSGSETVFLDDTGSFFTTVDPTKWDNNGVLDTINSANWSIQRVFSYPQTNTLYIYYGQSEYSTFTNALQYLASDPFVEGLATQPFTVFVGYLILKGNTTNLADTANNRIIQAGLYRSTVGGSTGGAAATTNLEDLADVNITSPSTGQALIYDAGFWVNGTPLNATTASFAITSSNAFTASYAFDAVSASYAVSSSNSISSSYAINSSNSVSSSYAQTASFVNTAQTASYVLNAVSSSHADNSDNAISSSFAQTASFVDTALTASYVVSSSYAASSSNAISSSYAIISSDSVSSSFASTASYVENAQTASYVLNAVSSSYSTTASYAVDSSNSVSSSYALTASYALNVPDTASYAVSSSNAVSSSYSISGSNSVSSSFALTASYALNAEGGGGATTGSNTFKGDQIISGSLTVTGSIAGNVILTPTTASNVIVSAGFNGMLISPVQLQGSSSVAIGSNLIIL